MARKPMQVTILAKPHPTDAAEYAFQIEDHHKTKLKASDPLVFRKGDFPGMKKSDVHEVKFKLDQQPGMTLEFAQSAEDVFWVAMGDEHTEPPCPDERPDKASDVIFVDKSTPQVLTVINTNPCPQKFSFTINFVDRTHTGPKKLIPYDPGGSNQNGGIDGFDPGIATNVIAGAVAAVALLTVAFVVLR